MTKNILIGLSTVAILALSGCTQSAVNTKDVASNVGTKALSNGGDIKGAAKDVAKDAKDGAISKAKDGAVKAADQKTDGAASKVLDAVKK